MPKKSREYPFTDANFVNVLNTEIKNHKKVHGDFLKALKAYILKSTVNSNKSLKLLCTQYPKTCETTSLKIYFILHSLQWDEPKIQDVIYSENIFQSKDAGDAGSKCYHQYLQLMYTFYQEHGVHPTSRNILYVFTQNHTKNLTYIRGLLKQVQEAMRLENQLKMSKKIHEQILHLLAQDVRRLVKIFISLFKEIIQYYNSFTFEQREILLVVVVNFSKLHGPIEKLFKKGKIEDNLDNALLNTQKVIALMEIRIAHHIKDWTDPTTSKELNVSIVKEIEKLGWAIRENDGLPSKPTSTPPIRELNLTDKNSLFTQKSASSTSSSDTGGYSSDRRLSGRSDSFTDSDATSSSKFHRNITQRPSNVFERPRESSFDEKDDSSSRRNKVGDQPLTSSLNKVKSIHRNSTLPHSSSTLKKNNNMTITNIKTDETVEEIDNKMTKMSIKAYRDEKRLGVAKKQFPIDETSPFDRTVPHKDEMKYDVRECTENEKKLIATPFDDDDSEFNEFAGKSNQARRDPFGPYESDGSDQHEEGAFGYRDNDLQAQRSMKEFEMGTEESKCHAYDDDDDEQDDYPNQFSENCQREWNKTKEFEMQDKMGTMSCHGIAHKFEPLSSRFSKVKSSEKLGSFGNLPSEQKQEFYGENEWSQENQGYSLQQQSLNHEFDEHYRYDSEEYNRNYFQMNQKRNSGFRGFSEE